MKKIINFIKKNYVMVTIIVSIIFILIISLLVGNIINKRNQAKYSKSEEAFYEYFSDEKHEFNAELDYENNILINMVGINYTIYGSNIIYSNNDNKMILPKDYEIVFYFTNVIYKLSKYSEISYIVDMDTINSNGKSLISSKYFLYDGTDTYFFPDDFILNVGGNDVNVSAYSYIYVTDDIVTVYDYKNDKVTKYNQNSKYASVKLNDLYVSLDKKAYKYNDTLHLLDNNIDGLSVYE